MTYLVQFYKLNLIKSWNTVRSNVTLSEAKTDIVLGNGYIVGLLNLVYWDTFFF